MAIAYGADAKVYSNDALKLSDITLANVGNAPAPIGAAFALQNAGEKTPAFEVEGQGVVIIELKSKSAAAEIGDYSIYENQLLQSATSAVNNRINQAIRDKVEVVDERYKYF